MERTALEDLRDYSQIHMVKPLSRVQRRESEIILSPHINELKEIVELARYDVDREIAEEFTRDPTPRVFHFKSPSYYPVGHCEIIREGIMDRLMEMAGNPVDRKNAAIQSLCRLATANLPIRRVYGIVDFGTKPFFQNAIQFGHLIVDAAVDTFIGDGRRVEIYDIDSGRLDNIENYEQYAQVVQKYWGLPVSKTADYFPYLAPLFPLILGDPTTDRAYFARNHALFFKNIVEDFTLSEAITNSSRKFDRLPPKTLEKIRSRFRRENGLFKLQENRTQQGKVFQFHRKEFHPLLNGSNEETKRKLLDKLVGVYEGLDLPN